MAAAGLVSLFTDGPVTQQYLLILPLAVWEMAIAVWLLVRGAAGGHDADSRLVAHAPTSLHGATR